MKPSNIILLLGLLVFTKPTLIAQKKSDNLRNIKKQIETDITKQRKSTENVIAFNPYLENKNVNKKTPSLFNIIEK